MTKAPAATPRGTATACPPLYLLDAIDSLRNRATRNSDILSPVLFIRYKAGPGGPIAADEVHLPLRAGPPAALRARRPHPRTGRTVVRPRAGAPGHRRDRLLAAARPQPEGRPGRGGLGGVAGDGGAARKRPRPPAGRQQLHPGAAPAPVQQGAGAAALRPEPVLRGPGLGPRRPRLLRRQRPGLPGLLPADRQPRGPRPARAGRDRPAAPPDGRPGRLPVRAGGRHGAPDWHRRRRPHARQPGGLRLPPDPRRGRADRGPGLALIRGAAGWTRCRLPLSACGTPSARSRASSP